MHESEGRSERNDPDVYSMTVGMAKGRPEPFNRFYEAYYDRLYRYLLVVARGDDHLARDCLQETMLRVVRYVKPIREENVFWGWLARVARTTFIDELRRRRKRATAPLWIDPAAREPGEPSVLLDYLDEATADLPEDERRLLAEYYEEGLSQARMAERRRSTPKAVESRLARIRHKIRRVLLGRLKREQGET